MTTVPTTRRRTPPSPTGRSRRRRRRPRSAPGYAGYTPPGAPVGAYGVSSQAPYGLDPRTGIPYSEKSKVVAGLLQILLPFGIGRYYIGDTKTGVWQTVGDRADLRPRPHLGPDRRHPDARPR